MLDWLTRWASGLRFPALLALIAGLFLLDLAIPDLIPLADEVLLGLLTVALASLRRTRSASAKRPAAAGTVDVDPVRDRDGSSRRDR